MNPIIFGICMQCVECTRVCPNSSKHYVVRTVEQLLLFYNRQRHRRTRLCDGTIRVAVMSFVIERYCAVWESVRERDIPALIRFVHVRCCESHVFGCHQHHHHRHASPYRRGPKNCSQCVAIGSAFEAFWVGLWFTFTACHLPFTCRTVGFICTYIGTYLRMQCVHVQNRCAHRTSYGIRSMRENVFEAI